MGEGTELTYDTSREELVEFVPAGATSLLDVGCGAGHYAAALRRQRPGVEIWGIEPDDAHAEVAKRSMSVLIKGSFPEVSRQLPPSTFDVVTFNDVLEHMVDPLPSLRAAAELLGPGGVVIASIPNVRHRSVLWPLLRRADWTYEDNGLLDRTHVRFFTKRTMATMFVHLGWTVDSVVGINRCWDWRDGGGERRLLRNLRRAFGARLDDFFYVQYVVVARPPGANSEGAPQV